MRDCLLFVGCYLQICDIRSRDAGDETISESYKSMDLSLVDGSLVGFCPLKPQQPFFRPPTLVFLARYLYSHSRSILLKCRESFHAEIRPDSLYKLYLHY